MNSIFHLTYLPHGHNGYAGRRHNHVVEIGLTLLSYANMPTSHWTLHFTNVSYFINRIPPTILQNQSSYRIFVKEPPTEFWMSLLSMTPIIHSSQT